MISEVDEALRTLIRSDALKGSEVEVVLDAPTKDWAARRNAPTVDCYLYDIREDLRRRERGWVNVRDDEGTLVGRRPVPRYYKLSYLVTAWTQRPEDEHRLLSALLRCFIARDEIPRDLVAAPLGETGLPLPVTVALPPPEDRAFADVWSALGGEFKPSLDVVVSVPIDIGVVYPAGPPVTEGPAVTMSDTRSNGIDPKHKRHVPQPAKATAGARS
ncbi:MAG: DUF4255 domain-containing protein [Dermatophilaceae bacterium]